MRKSGILLALVLALGLVACESETPEPVIEPAQLDAVLAEYSADRAEVVSAIAEARDLDLQTTEALDRAAARHALDLASHRTSTHMGGDGSSPMERLRHAGAGMKSVREFIFRIEGDRDDLGNRAAKTWLAPVGHNGVLTEPCTHAAVAFAPLEDGGCVGVLLLAQR
jgi:uncharacterized protein YkwD